MLTVRAPAKLNLTLEILCKREDGFHEILSAIQTIDLCDVLSFQSSNSVEIKSDSIDWIAEKSLVSKAVSLLQETTGCSNGVKIEVKKNIPLVSGLGGDSSDAAATLRGLNKFWELGLTDEELLRLSMQLGSDVPFFLYGGTALIEGRGELVTPLPALSQTWFLLAVPPVPVIPEKTKQLYSDIKPNHYTDGLITQRLITELEEGNNVSSSFLFNTFENVAFTRFPGLEVAKEHMLKIGTTDVHLAGSGPTMFTMVDDRNRAEELFQQLKKQRLNPYLVESIDTIENME
jgi:4-diphosphocytidyl-2-C-methyl-D-erythritol kinase